MIKFHIAALAILGGLAASAQAAPVSALTFTAASTNSTTTTTTRGYAFNVTSAGLVATHLSFWDEGGDGLGQSHDVGLWNPAGILIASATVPSGTAATLLDGFRFVDIADVALPVGNGYVVGALFLDGSPDRQALSLSGLGTASGITYVQGRFINGPVTLTLPTTSLSLGLPGGSLLVDLQAIAVPEPTTLALAALALAALVRRPASTRSA